MACENDPGYDRRRQDGLCHVCQTWASCGFCPLCCHWICRSCNPNLFKRAIAAIKEVLGTPTPNCCGPNAARPE